MLFWLCWIFIALGGLSLVAGSGRCSSLRCAGFSLCGFSCGAQIQGPWALVAIAHGLNCSLECGIFLDQGLNPCTLH